MFDCQKQSLTVDRLAASRVGTLGRTRLRRLTDGLYYVIPLRVIASFGLVKPMEHRRHLTSATDEYEQIRDLRGKPPKRRRFQILDLASLMRGPKK